MTLYLADGKSYLVPGWIPGLLPVEDSAPSLSLREEQESGNDDWREVEHDYVVTSLTWPTDKTEPTGGLPLPSHESPRL